MHSWIISRLFLNILSKPAKVVIIYISMKKYILSLFAFIVLYICAMYGVQTYTSLKPAGKVPQSIFAKFKQKQSLPDIIAGDSATPQKDIQPDPLEQETIRLLKEEQEKIKQQTLAQEEEKKKADAKRDELFQQKGLVNAETLPAAIFLDIRYATNNNFTGKPLYKSDKCYLQKDTADALVAAAQYALDEEKPFYLCIYDCYRPRSAQKQLWNVYPVPGQVADPKTGSNHTRGTAIDLGPCNAEGYPLAMPTGFDDFTENAYAYADDEDISPEAIANRKALQKVMRKAGFTTIRKEWWHFNYKDAKKYPLLDLEF